MIISIPKRAPDHISRFATCCFPHPELSARRVCILYHSIAPVAAPARQIRRIRRGRRCKGPRGVACAPVFSRRDRFLRPPPSVLGRGDLSFARRKWHAHKHSCVSPCQSRWRFKLGSGLERTFGQLLLARLRGGNEWRRPRGG